MNVKFVKLVTGEEVVCDLTIDDDFYHMRKPCILVPNGQSSMAIIPWMTFTEFEDDTAAISKVHVVAVGNPISEVTKQYQSAMTGIVTPNTEVLSAPKLTLTE
jgi:hypothetical protein